jgi:type IV pilus assembly protein PilN
MIRINLVTVERAKAKSRKPSLALSFDIAQRVTLICGVILVLGVAAIGWRFMALRAESARVDAAILTAQEETARLQSVIQQVQQFEAQRAQLQQRVTLIEQLRKEQTGPVHMLDQVSRALPPMLWLTQLRQGANANEVLIQGRVTTMTGLSDFVTNLENTGYFKKSVEIVNSEAASASTPSGELITFSLRAQFQTPGAPEPPAPAPAKTAKGRKR